MVLLYIKNTCFIIYLKNKTCTNSTTNCSKNTTKLDAKIKF